MSFSYNRGFTLIELLVVIAVIGILSSIVLASLNSAKGKGSDARIKQQLAALRNAAEVYYNDNNSYSSIGLGAFNNNCNLGMFGSNSYDVKTYVNQANYPNSPTITCNETANGTAYAVSVTLSSGAWCVDSTGRSKAVSGSLAANVTACP